jgi:hypothetical protein
MKDIASDVDNLFLFAQIGFRLVAICSAMCITSPLP